MPYAPNDNAPAALSSEVFTPEALALVWRCKPRNVYALIRSGELLAFKINGKYLRIRAEAVVAYECRSTCDLMRKNLAYETGQFTLIDVAQREMRAQAILESGFFDDVLGRFE